MLRSIFAVAMSFTVTAGWASAQANASVRVYVLAGQSNMEGKAQNKLWDHQATSLDTAEIFAHLRSGDAWATRDDVFIRYGGRKGKLTLGYGSRNRTGVELEFGTRLGTRYDEPVLLIKTCWGGHSLVRNFRPPSAGLPSEEALKKELESARSRATKQNEKRKEKNPEAKDAPLPTMEDITGAYGASYRKMMAEVREVLDGGYREMFPALAKRKLRVAGFVWFQGWNDQYGGAEKEYASNLECLIRDVRKDLGVPKLPLVIGVMGQNGSKPAKGAMLTIQQAQLSMPKIPEFASNVRAVRTDVLVDRAAEKLYPKWRENFEQWEKTGSDHAYHYLGSAIWHVRMGRAFADAMLELAN